jgi:hypothetical protein
MNKRVTQDDGRERLQIKLFNLKPTQGRSNKYLPDATIDGYATPIELKSSDVEKGKISTSRSFGLKKIEEWKQVSFVFSQFEKSPAGEVKLLKHVYCSAKDMQPFFDSVEQKIRRPSEKSMFAGLDQWEEVAAHLEKTGYKGNIDKLSNTFERGTRLNDPRIKWGDVETWGTLVDSGRPALHLRELLSTEEDNV